MTVLCDQVTQCSGSLTFSLISTTSTYNIFTVKAKELWIIHDAHVYNRVRELIHMHLFLLETECQSKLKMF